jgi:hypothetical protein
VFQVNQPTGGNMVTKRLIAVMIVALAVLSLFAASPALANRGNGALGVIYVTSQGKYYDTFVTNEVLPMEGSFQKLTNHTTEFGPGDPGYLGGRWWVDLNNNNIMDPTDMYFHCPLLGPGRSTP